MSTPEITPTETSFADATRWIMYDTALMTGVFYIISLFVHQTPLAILSFACFTAAIGLVKFLWRRHNHTVITNFFDW